MQHHIDFGSSGLTIDVAHIDFDSSGLTIDVACIDGDGECFRVISV